MAWIYLAESVDSLSPWHHGLGHSPTVKTIDTLRASCSIVCTSGISRVVQSGMMCEPFDAKLCPWCRISCTEVFPARTSALPGMVEAWLANGLECIGNSLGWLKSYNPSSSSWKTSRRSEPVELAAWLDHLPASGMTRTGMLFPRKRSARPSLATVGFVLPRPTAKHYGSNRGGGMGRVGKPRHSIHQLATRGLLPGHPKGALNREYLELVMGYPARWTEIEPWAMQWFRSKRERRLKD